MTQAELFLTVALLLFAAVAVAALTGAAVARFVVAASRSSAKDRATRPHTPVLPR